jgi:hypothetical protein
MAFFESEIVKQELDDIFNMQVKIGKEVLRFSSMTKEEKNIHIDLLSNLLEKQQLLYTRLSLSDDPKAIEMKKQIQESSKLLGFKNMDIHEIFRSMKMTVDNLKKTSNRDIRFY